MFKCYECGARFEWPEEVEESRGEYWGCPCTEKVFYCPLCGSSGFTEIEDDEAGEEDGKCAIWVSYFLVDGTQCGATLYVDGEKETIRHKDVEKMLVEMHGDMYCDIADYGFYDDLFDDQEGVTI